MRANRLTQLFTDGQERLGAAIAQLGDKGAEVAAQLSSGTLPEVRLLPEPVRSMVEDFYAQAISQSFLIGVPLAVLSLVAILFLPNTPLTRMTTGERAKAEADKKHSPVEDAAGIAVADATAMAGAHTDSIPVISRRDARRDDAAPDGDR